MSPHRITSRQVVASLLVLVVSPIAVTGSAPADELRGGRSGDQSQSAEEADVSPVIEGFTEPYADINMAASEMGILARVTVKEGDAVEAGQLLANLDDAVLRASLAVAKAGMSAKGELQYATTQLELKTVELQKLTQLFRRNHASQRELDRVAGEIRIAESRFQSVQEDLAVRRLEYARIQAQVKQRHILSPIQGVVDEVRKDSGEFVSPTDPVVMRIVQLDPLRVVFSVPVDRRQEIVAGTPVQLQIGPTSAPALATVEYVSPTVDAASGTFRVKVRLPNPEQKWHSGEKSVLLLDHSIPPFAPLARAPTRTN
ncbi:MAG: efflux RND transporter periplasmic adaptor subunit [Fuerstiella sp.]|nr:efflux RND transporter periplasmic adaptor subunit [Fuerstiella sp.]